MTTTFSTAAFRSFKKFVGELTAVAAGMYVGIQEVIPLIDGLDVSDPWESVAKKHNVKLCGLKSERVLSSTIRLNLVSLYSGIDLFLLDIRNQFHHLHGKPWIQYDGDTQFMALSRNTPSGKIAHESRLGLNRIIAMDYYRLIRNSIAHPSDAAKTAVEKFYSENQQSLIRVSESYGMKSVPSRISSLSFHDIKFLARLALDLASAVDMDFDPGDEKLYGLVPEKFQGLAKSMERLHNARKGWLSVTYGIQSDRADRILALKKTH